MNNNQVKAIRDYWVAVTKNNEITDYQALRANRVMDSIRGDELAMMVIVPGLGSVTVAALRWAFEQVENKADWKAPIDTQVPGGRLLLTLAAIEFYQADKATSHPCTVYDHKTGCRIEWRIGDSTLDTLPMVRVHIDYWVRSRGYVC